MSTIRYKMEKPEKNELPAGPLFVVIGRYSTYSKKIKSITLAKKNESKSMREVGSAHPTENDERLDASPNSYAYHVKGLSTLDMKKN